MAFLSSIHQVSAAEWDALWLTDYPFVKHQFLALLEDSGCTNPESGWEPYHLIVREGQALVFAMVLYRKRHSYGEYVFDWGWADAYHRVGFDYYPKLLSAIPFTPATGPRMAFAPSLSREQQAALFNDVRYQLHNHCEQMGYSGFHVLFPGEHNRKTLVASGWSERRGHQFHWINDGYKSFDDFLSRFSSRKRKALNRERRKVKDAGIALSMSPAKDLEERDWVQFYQLYQRTYLKRSGHKGYLSKAFFLALGQSFPENVLLCRATKQGEQIAGALYFQDDTTLYGRYWGAIEEVDGLHFEACYYQGIEYAIQRRLTRFDPGAQGEHKIQRGFTPVETCSFHWLEHGEFYRAVQEFVENERQANDAYIEDVRASLPFKEGVELVDSKYLL